MLTVCFVLFVGDVFGSKNGGSDVRGQLVVDQGRRPYARAIL